MYPHVMHTLALQAGTNVGRSIDSEPGPMDE